MRDVVGRGGNEVKVSLGGAFRVKLTNHERNQLCYYKLGMVPKSLSTHTFERIAWALLAVCLLLTGYWTVTNSGLFRLISGVVGGRWQDLSLFLSIFLTFLALFAGWLLIVVPLRRLTPKPTLRQELRDLPAAYRQAQQELDDIYRSDPAGHSPATKRQMRGIGLVYILLGLTFCTAAALSLIVSVQEGRVLGLQLMLVVLGVLFVGGGVYQLVTGRPVVRR